LGAGAFGDVYLAKNKINGKFYAIKHMEKSKIMEHGAKLDIVLREINIHKRLVHNNIIRLLSHYEDKDSFYLIMEYAPGKTLFSLIKARNGLSEKDAFKYFINTASAVNFLHENNFIHRDLKPENLLIDENDNVKLCDFGWCVELNIGSRNTFCGTYEYMAPEIINESPYNSGIDVWSLGVLLYELIHGYSPFRATVKKNTEQEYIEIFRNIVKYNLKIEKNISESCADLIKKLLTPDINNRLKVKDIFYHPWVVSFEKEYKERKLKEISLKEQIYQNIEVSNKNTSEIKEKAINKEKTEIEEKLNKEINKKIYLSKENNNNKQINGKNDFSIFESNNLNKDSLFDKVLSQVEEKNRSKKKKRKRRRIRREN